LARRADARAGRRRGHAPTGARGPAARGPRPHRHPAPRRRRPARTGRPPRTGAAGGRVTIRAAGADAVFGALADPTRRRLLSTIAEHPATATQLAGGLPISRPGVRTHL